MYDLVAVGHFSIDSILLPSRQTPFVLLGGSAAYVTLSARRLEARTAVISKVGNDFPEAYRWWLEQESVNLAGLTKLENAQTTRFELEYDSDLSNRTMLLKVRTPPLTIEDIPNALKALAIHIAPIAGEVTQDVIEKLRERADVLSFDPQGLVRKFDENGRITYGQLANPQILDLINIYKSSQKEIEALTALTDLNSAIDAVHDHGVRIVIVTLGAKGSVLSVEGSLHYIPACKPEKLVDPTGAGDAFIGGFLTEYTNDANILRCACIGSAAASFVLEGIGPTFFGDKIRVYERARELYEKGIKQ